MPPYSPGCWYGFTTSGSGGSRSPATAASLPPPARPSWATPCGNPAGNRDRSASSAEDRPHEAVSQGRRQAERIRRERESANRRSAGKSDKKISTEMGDTENDGSRRSRRRRLLLSASPCLRVSVLIFLAAVPFRNFALSQSQSNRRPTPRFTPRGSASPRLGATARGRSGMQPSFRRRGSRGRHSCEQMGWA